MSERREWETFLFLHGAVIAQLVLVTSVVANLIVAVHWFSKGGYIFGSWALCAGSAEM